MSNRDQRQAEAILKWKVNGLNGTIDACVGFGKTRMTIVNVLEPIYEKYPDYRGIIIVPNTDLVKQWSDQISHLPYRVYTVQGLITRPPEEYDFIIYDEVHKYFGKKFSQVLRYKARWKLGLSGSLNYTARQNLKMYNLPVVDTITLKESVKNGWNNTYREYNLKVYLSKADSQYLHKQDLDYYKYLSVLSGGNELDFSVVQKVSYKKLAGYKQKNGVILTYKSGKKKGQPIPIWNYPYAEDIANRLGKTPSEIIMIALRIQKIVRDRKKFFYNYEGKIPVVKSIIERFHDRKIIGFTMEQEFCDRMAKECGVPSYHGNFKKSTRLSIMNKFKTDDTGALLACLAINEGVDIPNLDVCINISYFSTSASNMQRLGRSVRKNLKNKDSIIINLVTVYHPSIKSKTVEEKWLRKFQDELASSAHFIETIDDIII